MEKLALKITDMHCVNCVMRLEGIEDLLPGIKSAVGSYRKQTLLIEYDDKVIGREDIIKAIKDIGYTPE